MGWLESGGEGSGEAPRASSSLPDCRNDVHKRRTLVTPAGGGHPHPDLTRPGRHAYIWFDRPGRPPYVVPSGDPGDCNGTANVGSTMDIITAQQLIDAPRDMRPHVVLLGAGASRAAFPKGDPTGKRIPVMDDLVDILGLQRLLDEAGPEIELGRNFEAIYSQLDSHPKYIHIIKTIEAHIDDYFSDLSLPIEATIYDRLLVSLRSTDAVITFNWDPFLFDAYLRNRDAIPLPEIFFLHGNVRIGACLRDDSWGARNGRCPDCGRHFVDVPLLYSIQKKDYSKDPYIRRNWEAAEALCNEAFTMTIFGYSAPTSDTGAVELLRRAWFARSKRELEHIEIIDIASDTDLYARWSPFTPTLHYHSVKAFEQSRISRWPRRSCEALLYPMTQGIPCEDFPLPSTDNLAELQAYASTIALPEDGLRPHEL